MPESWTAVTWGEVAKKKKQNEMKQAAAREADRKLEARKATMRQAREARANKENRERSSSTSYGGLLLGDVIRQNAQARKARGAAAASTSRNYTAAI